MRRDNTRITCALAAALGLSFAAVPALAQEATSKIDGADTAWMIAATGLVLMMTIPGLALFYAGMVRKKNVLATMAQSRAATCLLWLLSPFLRYSLTLKGDVGIIGPLRRRFIMGMAQTST